MNIGDYVRTIYGIAKIENISCGEDLWFDNDNIFEDEEIAHNYRLNPPSMYGSWAKDNIIKSNSNILKLIEAGDYVNGYKVESVYAPYGVYIEIPFVDSESIGCDVDLIRTEEIESIVTKEQFEKNEYKI
jgi:hypothetical protein